MKQIKLFAFLLACVILSACNKSNEPEIVQTVTGVADCSACQQWSWNDGCATKVYESGKEIYFEFIVKHSGTLSFDYSVEQYEGTNWLAVNIDGTKSFSTASGRERHAIIGHVSKNQIIKFYASDKISISVEVWNIKIVADGQENNTSDYDF